MVQDAQDRFEAQVELQKLAARRVVMMPDMMQAQQKLMAGVAWGNTDNLVFTDALGKPLMKSTVYREFKMLAAAIGRPDARFHDLRHTFAVASIRSGDDIKTIQGNLGHATASGTPGNMVQHVDMHADDFPGIVYEMIGCLILNEAYPQLRDNCIRRNRPKQG